MCYFFLIAHYWIIFGINHGKNICDRLDRVLKRTPNNVSTKTAFKRTQLFWREARSSWHKGANWCQGKRYLQLKSLKLCEFFLLSIIYKWTCGGPIQFSLERPLQSLFLFSERCYLCSESIIFQKYLTDQHVLQICLWIPYKFDKFLLWKWNWIDCCDLCENLFNSLQKIRKICLHIAI